MPQLLAAGTKVVDFSADYRLSGPKVYQEWYGQKHSDPDRLGKVVYGLPELFRERIRAGHFVANPGCYPSSRHPGPGPVGQGPADRSAIDHHRRQERRIGSRPHAQADVPLIPSATKASRPTMSAGIGTRPRSNKCSPTAGGQRRAGDLHAAPGADGPRHPGDDLFRSRPAD